MKYLNTTFLLAGFVLLLSCSDSNVNPEEIINIPEGYSLIWQDEFNDSKIDLTNWKYETGDGTDYGLPVGWGNNESQIYTVAADNSGIETDEELSALYIKALSDGAGGFTSAKLTTANSFSMHFGRVDIKAKMPQGQGIWSAIWMLGDNIDQIDWPGCGEIDIAEILGHEPNKMYSTIHYTDGENSHAETQESLELTSDSFSDSYHIFSLAWTPESLTFSVDGTEINEVLIEDDMKEFLRSFYFVMNVAVGGNWPGSPDNSTSFPQSMFVDYIRVFEKNGFNAPESPALDIDEESIGQNIEPSLAQHAIKDGFTNLGNASVIVYGGGGEPVVAASELAIDGDFSLEFSFPGTSWGGGYIELAASKDLSSFNYLNFSLNSTALANAEIKLESPGTNAAIFLKDYAGTDVGQGFKEYTIPLADFTGLDLTKIKIPFSMWNPQDASENFVAETVLIDNLFFSN